jgi:RNA polymerase sigma-70 factor (ECF subfamily)
VVDKPEFATLVEQHGAELYAYLCRMLDDPHEAEDCLQEVFLRAFRAYFPLEGNSNFRAWLYKIATNRALTLRKKRARIHSQEVVLEHQALPSQDNPSHSFDVRERLRQVAQAVNRLPVHQRASIMMRKYQEMSYQDIGAALGCSAESARANVYQGLKKLRQQFGED